MMKCRAEKTTDKVLMWSNPAARRKIGNNKNTAQLHPMGRRGEKKQAEWNRSLGLIDFASKL